MITTTLAGMLCVYMDQIRVYIYICNNGSQDKDFQMCSRDIYDYWVVCVCV